MPNGRKYRDFPIFRKKSVYLYRSLISNEPICRFWVRISMETSKHDPIKAPEALLAKPRSLRCHLISQTSIEMSTQKTNFGWKSTVSPCIWLPRTSSVWLIPYRFPGSVRTSCPQPWSCWCIPSLVELAESAESPVYLDKRSPNISWIRFCAKSPFLVSPPHILWSLGT